MEKLFNFLFHYNVGLIESLMILIAVLLIVMFYRVFFASTPVRMDVGGGAPTVNINTAEIEKSLKELMENQATSLAALEAKTSTISGVPGIDPEVQKENIELKHKIEVKAQQMAELEKKMQDVQKQLADTSEKAKSSNSGHDELEKKIKDLELRLQEYEIISEDISDLSHFKEENARLQAEIDALKGSGATPAPSNVTPIKPKLAAVEEPVEEMVEEPEEPIPARDETSASMFSGPASDESAEEPPVEDAALFDGVPEMEVKPPDPEENEASMAGGSVIDDDLMKEFEAAVEDQKNSGQSEEEAPTGVAADSGDTKLLDQFESFVKKA